MHECSCRPVGLHGGPLLEGQEEISRDPGGTGMQGPSLEAAKGATVQGHYWGTSRSAQERHSLRCASHNPGRTHSFCVLRAALSPCLLCPPSWPLLLSLKELLGNWEAASKGQKNIHLSLPSCLGLVCGVGRVCCRTRLEL